MLFQLFGIKDKNLGMGNYPSLNLGWRGVCERR
jgi:hypothetical protein